MDNNGNRFLRPAADTPRVRQHATTQVIELVERWEWTTDETGHWWEIWSARTTARFRVRFTEAQMAELVSDARFAALDEDAEGLAEVEG